MGHFSKIFFLEGVCSDIVNMCSCSLGIVDKMCKSQNGIVSVCVYCRSLSPAFRNPERNRQRHNLINYDCDHKGFRRDPKKPMPWRMEDGKYGQASSRYVPQDINYHHRLNERRSHSPTLKRIPSEDMHSHKPFRMHSPERTENIRRCQFPSKYSEMSRKEQNQSFYPTKIRERDTHEDIRTSGNTKGMKNFHRPLDNSCKFERNWNENGLRHQQLQEEKHPQLSRRFSDEFMPRSSLQKR